MGRDAFILVFAIAAAAAHGAAPRLEWSYETRGKIYASPIIADLENDGRSEVIVCASRDRRVICLDGSGEVRWDYQLRDAAGDGIQATPSVVDYDGDGRKEVFFADEGGVVGCLDSRGKLIWRVFTGDRVDYSGPVVADVNGDSRIEVVFGSDSGTLYCLDDAGIELWHYQGDGSIRGIPAVLRDDATSTMRIYVTFSGGTAACLSSEGKVLWSRDEPSTAKTRRSGPALGDLDGDGRMEMISATGDFQVIACDATTGDERWRWKGLHQIDQTNSFALADFDGSGRLDVVCGDGAGLGGPGRVYRLRDGKALWTADVRGGVVQGPSIGDVDGDGALEILVCTRENRLVCLSQDGQEEWDYPSAAGALTTPAIGDVDADGKVEIVFTSKDGFVRCVTVDGAYHADRMPWPCLNHDPQLSGSMAGAAFATTMAAQPAQSPPLLDVSRFGPLRTGENRVEVSFANLSHRPRHLELVAEVVGPNQSAVTQTVSRRVQPYSKDGAKIAFDALDMGEYALSVRLLDVGTGLTLAEKSDRASFVPLEWEKQVIESRLEQARKSLSGLQDEKLRRRGAEAIAAQRARWEEMSRAVGAQDATSSRAEVRRLANAAHGILRECDRITARLRAAAATPGRNLDFAVAPVTTLRKIFRDEPCLTGETALSRCEIEVAGNELEGIQLVVVPLWKDIRGLHVSATDAVHSNGSARIPAQDIVVNRVGYIEIGPPEYNWYVEKRGFYPDVLFPVEPFDVPADQDAQPYFITVRARENTVPGDYRAAVVFQAEGCAQVKIPLKIHVWDFSISKDTHLKTSFWINEGYLRRFYKYEGRTPFEVRKRYYDYQLEHRTGPLMALPYDGGDVVEDFDYVLSHGQNNFFVHVPGYVEESGRAAEAERLRALHALVKQKGWNDSALFYSRDEVAVMARHEIPQVVEMNNWTRSIIPDWPRLQTSAPEQSLFGAVDIWCPTIGSFDPVVLAQSREKGDRLWFYTVWSRPGIMIEFPATDHRLMFWQCWKYGAEGFLYWGTTHWELNVTTDRRWPDIPWIPYNRQPGHNGCGYLIYPGPNGTPLGSLRFELVRDGIEDFEYFYLLRELLAAAGEGAPAELRARAEAELAVSPEVLVDHNIFTEDPEVILNARGRVAALIEQLRKLPGR